MSIDVTVKKEGGNWVCDPETLTVTTKNKKIKFGLATDGYTFRGANAVVVQEGGTQFPEPAVTEDGKKKVSLLDVNTVAGYFKYTVYLVEDATGQPVVIDPGIRNNPE